MPWWLLAACGDPSDRDPTHATPPGTWAPVGTGPASGEWGGQCAGSFDVDGTVSGGSGAPVHTVRTLSYDLDPATLRLDDQDGALSGRFTYTRADLPELEPDDYRVTGQRAGSAVTLRIVGLASTSSTFPTSIPSVFPFSLDLDLQNGGLAGDLVVTDGGEELGRVACSFALR